ncbi:MAG: hypothetical protein Q9170_001673 [Blastenia crenularia]
MALIIKKFQVEAGEELVNVPPSALLTVDNVPNKFRKTHETATVHGLLASFLAFGDEVDLIYGPWLSTWPSLSEFRKSMPLCWPEQSVAGVSEEMLDNKTPTKKTQLPLPPAIERPNSDIWSGDYSGLENTSGILQRQREKLKADWGLASRVVPDASFERYLYYWFIVNTRSFYYETSKCKGRPSREDCMVLCPFVDLFNHNDTGVSPLSSLLQVHADIPV